MKVEEILLATERQKVYEQARRGFLNGDTGILEQVWAKFDERSAAAKKAEKQRRQCLKKGSDWVLNETPVPTKYYTIMEKDVLGKGAFGVVTTCVEKKNKVEWVCKKIEKPMENRDEEFEAIRSEIEALMNLSEHPYVVFLHQMFENKTNIFFIMEYLRGGSLSKHIQTQS
jgi:hypothetical protein